MVNFSRKIILATAFLLAVGVFIGGFYFGALFDSARTSYVGELISSAQLDTESFIAERDFFKTFGVKDCDILNKRLDAISETLGSIGRQLAEYDIKKMSKTVIYNQLKRKYFLLEIDFYIMHKEFDGFCGGSNRHTVLFFYDITDNQDSLNQGYVLDVAAKNNDNLRVLSFDRTFSDPAVQSLVNYYNITKSPSIVVDFDKRYYNFVGQQELDLVLRYIKPQK